MPVHTEAALGKRRETRKRGGCRPATGRWCGHDGAPLWDGLWAAHRHRLDGVGVCPVRRVCVGVQEDENKRGGLEGQG